MARWVSSDPCSGCLQQPAWQTATQDRRYQHFYRASRNPILTGRQPTAHTARSAQTHTGHTFLPLRRCAAHTAAHSHSATPACTAKPSRAAVSQYDLEQTDGRNGLGRERVGCQLEHAGSHPTELWCIVVHECSGVALPCIQ